MLKAKITVEIEVDQDKIPPGWQQDLKVFFTTTLDGVMVYFSESNSPNLGMLFKTAGASESDPTFRPSDDTKRFNSRFFGDG